MYRVIYITFLGGIESQACRRFTTRAAAATFARLVHGTMEKRPRL
jgi:hypothetical protein